MEGGHCLPFAGPTGGRWLPRAHPSHGGTGPALSHSPGYRRPDRIRCGGISPFRSRCDLAAASAIKWHALLGASSVCLSILPCRAKPLPQPCWWPGARGARPREADGSHGQDLKSWSRREGRAGRERQGKKRDARQDEGKLGRGGRCCGPCCWATVRLEGLRSKGTLLSSPEPTRSTGTCWCPCDAVGGIHQGHCHRGAGAGASPCAWYLGLMLPLQSGTALPEPSAAPPKPIPGSPWQHTAGQG